MGNLTLNNSGSYRNVVFSANSTLTINAGVQLDLSGSVIGTSTATLSNYGIVNFNIADHPFITYTMGLYWNYGTTTLAASTTISNVMNFTNNGKIQQVQNLTIGNGVTYNETAVFKTKAVLI